jgi:lysophospholipase L1-like esterase
MIKLKFLSRYLLAILFAGVINADATDLSRKPQDNWVATWGAPPMSATSAGQPARSFENQTIRQIVHISAGGSRVRVRISNEFGVQPLRIGAAHIALAGSGIAITPGTDRVLRFGGLPTITIPSGAAVFSDPVDLPVLSRSDVAVSLYFPLNTGSVTYHDSANQTAYVSGAGDFTGSNTFTTIETPTSRYFLSAVEVAVPDYLGPVKALVTIGDSINEGFRSTTDANRRWPDFLSARINPRYGRPQLGVVNQGIGCGRLLFDFCGPGGAARFDRDVLAITGRAYVINAYGLVDIILPNAFGMPEQTVSSGEIIQGLKQIIERAHAQDIKIYGATILPFGASAFPGVFTLENEAKRQDVNRWIRTSGAYDAVIDFDAALRDHSDPTRILSIYVSDDGIHPNDAGYEAMANSINLSLFD